MIDVQSKHFDLDQDPMLLVGRRTKPRELEGFRVNLDRNSISGIREIAVSTITSISGLMAVDWYPDMAIEHDQFAVFDAGYMAALSAFVVDEDHSSEPPLEEDAIQSAGLLSLLRSTNDLEMLTPAALEAGDFRFYAVVWTSGDAGSLLAFVSEYNPLSIRHQARTFYSFDGSLRSLAPPDLALDSEADLVVMSDAIWMLRSIAFDRLFSDVRASLNDVESSVSAMERAFLRLPFSPISLKAIRRVCASKPTYARRLHLLAESEHARSITPALLKRALEAHGADSRYFISGGVVEIDRDEVGELLDVLEGRWYEADFSKEPRRAGRWTRRTARPMGQSERGNSNFKIST